MNTSLVIPVLQSRQSEFSQVVPFNEKKEKIAWIDLSASNKNFTKEIFSDTEIFSKYINEHLQKEKAAFLVGGYREKRNMYLRSPLFSGATPLLSAEEEPRTVHLGIDIWGAANTNVCAPLGGIVHSFALNNSYGDYGTTIILQHQLDTRNFYTLYGHLSSTDIGYLREGQFISRGEIFAHFGSTHENGNWPPHLHFQIILDIDTYHGDYPGVCKASEAGNWLSNSPDPDLILQMNRYIK